MARRAAKFISALFASVIAGAPVATMSQNAANAPAAADDCLPGPKGATPQGQHWYYRLDHANKRQCWYLREEGERPPQATATAPATDKPAAQKTEAPPLRSLQDAHAEVPMPRAASDQDATESITPAPAAAAPPAFPRADATSSGTQQPAVVSRWPDVSTSTAAVSAPAAPPVDAASVQQRQQSAPSPAAAVTLAAADLPVQKPTGSIQTLLLVVLGALGLAGLSGSVIYRFAGARNPVRHQPGQRRRVNWEPPADNSRAPWIGEARSITPRTQLAPEPVAVPIAQAVPIPQAVPISQAVAAPEPVPVPQPVAAFEDEPLLEPHPAASEREAETIDIDEITKLLEHLLQQGPRLDRPIAAAGSADYAQSRQGRSGVRA